MNESDNNLNEENREYELAYVLKEEDGLADILGVLERENASVSVKSVPEKIRLAYPIRKETEGFFGFARFTAESEKIKSMEKELRHNVKILRLLIVRKDKQTAPFREPQAAPSPAPDRIAEPMEKSAPSSGVHVSNEELRARLEEISK